MDLYDHSHHFALFPTVVQSTLHPDAERLNLPIREEIEKLRSVTPNSRSPLSVSDFYTTIQSCNDLHLRPEFEYLIEFFLSELNIFSNKQSICISDHGISINKCWFNIYNKTDSLDAHNHPNSIFSGVYFINAPVGSAPLVLVSDVVDKMIAVSIAEHNAFNGRSKVIKPEPGLLVLFNSNLMHNTGAHMLSEERISISFTATL